MAQRDGRGPYDAPNVAVSQVSRPSEPTTCSPFHGGTPHVPAFLPPPRSRHNGRRRQPARRGRGRPAVADGEWDNGDPNSSQNASATASDQPGGSNQSSTWNPNANSQSADNQASNAQSGNTQGGGNGNQTANTQGGSTQGGNTQGGDNGHQTANTQGGNTQGGDNGHQTANAQGGDWDQHGNQNDQRLYRGRVTASTLALRAAPNRGGQVIRYAHRGEIVSIFCKTGGQNVDGNRLWYLLTDGTWAWGSARYIDNIGAAPRWC